MAPVYASPGMFDSFLGFFGYAGDTGKRASNRILECTKDLEEVEKNDLFGSLSSSERKGATNYNEWEQKLKNSELDDKATRIHQKFMLDPAYIGQASEKNQRPIDVTYKEGGQMVVKGGQFLADAATTVVDTALPGFSKGVEIVQNINDKAEKTKKFVKKTYAGDMKGAVVEALKDKIDDSVTGKMGEVLGEEISDVVTHLTQQATGKEKPSELVDSGLNYGQAKIKDSDKKSKPQIAIALNKDDNAPIKMVTHVSDQDEPTLNLPEGGYLVVTSDQDGNCDADKDVAVVAGQETVVAVNTQGDDSTQTAKDIVTAVQQTIVAMQPKSSDDTSGNQQVETVEPKDIGKSFLDIVKQLQDAALAGLKGDNNGDGTGNGAGDGGSSDTAATGNQNNTGGSGNAVPTPIPTPAQVTGCDWNGRWKTNYAGLTLIQTGSQATGTYGLMGETMKGTVSGNTFTGTWKDPSNSASTNNGDIVLTMADDCNSFTGRWRYNSIEFDLEWDGIWTGTRIGTAP
jgi:hypothetical protein